MKRILFLLGGIAALLPLVLPAQHLVNEGQLVVESGSHLVVAGDATNDGGTLTNNGTLNVTGDVTSLNGGSVSSGSSSDLIFKGGTPQSLTGVSSLQSITVEAGSQVNLGSSVSLTGGLTLTDGKVQLGSYSLTLASGASITGGSSSNYIIASGSGELIQEVGGSAVSFPIGTASTYLPVILSNAGTPDNLGLRLGEGVYLEATSGSLISENVVGLTWFLTEATPGNLSLSATFQWTGTDEEANFDRSTSQLWHYTAGNWVEEGSSGAAAGGDPYTFTVGGISSLSPFAIGDDQATFPVEWLSFEATPRGGQVDLSWATAREENSAYFAIERSADEQAWTEIGQETAAGYAEAETHYGWTDRSPLRGLGYYRLRQVDMDGSFAYSPSVMVRLDGLAFSVFPNPVTDYLQLQVAGDWSAELIDTQGRVLRHTQGQGDTRLDLRGLPAGLYFLRLQAAGQVQSLNIRKE